MRKSPNICVLASGGVDSGILLRHALGKARHIYPLYVSQGFFWEKAELFWLNRLLKALGSKKIQTLSVLKIQDPFHDKQHWSYTGKKTPGRRSVDQAVYLPGRNLNLLTHAALFCDRRNLSQIWMGTLSANPFSDATPRFFRLFEKTSQAALGKKILVKTPFIKKRKDEVISLYPDFPFHLSFSCLKPFGRRHCEDCNKCEERRKYLLLSKKKVVKHARL